MNRWPRTSIYYRLTILLPYDSVVLVTIQSFACEATQKLFHGERVKDFEQFESVVMRKLAMLNRAGQLGDLLVPPGNRLEALKGDRKGQHSIRINDQYRVCFIWSVIGPADVEIVDYH